LSIIFSIFSTNPCFIILFVNTAARLHKSSSISSFLAKKRPNAAEISTFSIKLSSINLNHDGMKLP
jgi:hypothetical protein